MSLEEEKKGFYAVSISIAHEVFKPQTPPKLYRSEKDCKKAISNFSEENSLDRYFPVGVFLSPFTTLDVKRVAKENDISEPNNKKAMEVLRDILFSDEYSQFMNELIEDKLLKNKNLEITREKIIDSNDWNKFITEVYGKPYCLQQQEGCRGRGIIRLEVPTELFEEEIEYKKIPEITTMNDEFEVSFESWIKRDPKKPLNPTREELDLENKVHYEDLTIPENFKKWSTYKHRIDLFWKRHFYPNIHAIANDLYNKGLLKKGNYIINIDW